MKGSSCRVCDLTDEVNITDRFDWSVRVSPTSNVPNVLEILDLVTLCEFHKLCPFHCHCHSDMIGRPRRSLLGSANPLKPVDLRERTFEMLNIPDYGGGGGMGRVEVTL